MRPEVSFVHSFLWLAMIAYFISNCFKMPAQVLTSSMMLLLSSSKTPTISAIPQSFRHPRAESVVQALPLDEAYAMRCMESCSAFLHPRCRATNCFILSTEFFIRKFVAMSSVCIPIPGRRSFAIFFATKQTNDICLFE